MRNLFASDSVWEGAFETFEGRAELRRFIQGWLDAYDRFEFAAE